MLKKMLNGKKGLTLVELLAVLVILGIVAAIAVPTIGSTIENSRKKADLGTYNLIVDAAIRYSLEEQMKPGGTGIVAQADGNIATVLVGKGYLLKEPGALQSDTSKSFVSFSVDIAAGVTTVEVYSGATTADKIDPTIFQ